MHTKQDELLAWMRNKKTFASHEVIAWGLDNFYNRADRTKRDFVEEGLLIKLSPFEKKWKGYTCKDAVYKINEKEIANYLQPSLF